jgi:hypothetical protein
MTQSRAKGCRGELEASKVWAHVMGGKARRGQQFAGGTDSPDVISDYPGIHLEVKRTERGNPYDWLAQARRDARGKCPVVLHRRNNQPWLLIMELSDAPKFLLEAGAGPQTEEVGRGTLPLHVPAQSVRQVGGTDAGSPGVFPAERRRRPRGDRSAGQPGSGRTG